jgi:hypothetical protein
MSSQSETNTYIIAQLQAGLTLQDIAGQLRAAGWPDATIQAAFEATRQQIALPQVAEQEQAAPAASTAPGMTTDSSPTSIDRQPTQLPPPIKRGRMKTGWLLFKQSLRIIKENPGLSRYVIMSLLWSIGVFVVLTAVAFFDTTHAHLFFYETANSYAMTLPGFALLALTGFLATLATYYYGVALSSHVLAIFRGAPGTYQQHIARAKQRFGTIAMYALIATIVGYLLRLLEERFKLVGWIISRILGALWSLATSFVLPVIADSAETSPQAIKHSVNLFKANWGETIVSRISLISFIVLLYILVGLPIAIILAIVLGSVIGVVGILIALGFYIVGIIVLGVLNALASNILNVCLYYYAQYQVIPPAFSPELLASVFVEKKRKK